jgi:PKD repeat protein
MSWRDSPTDYVTKYFSEDYIALVAYTTGHANEHIQGGEQAIPDATTSSNGLMSVVDKTALDALVATGVVSTSTGTPPIVLSAASSLSSETTGAELSLVEMTTNGVMIPYGIFQAGANRTVESLTWDRLVDVGFGASNFTARIESTVSETETGNSIFLIYAVRIPSTGDYDTPLPLVATITSSYTAAYKKVLSATTTPFTISGTGDTILFKVVRSNAAGDTITGEVLFRYLFVSVNVSLVPVVDFSASALTVYDHSTTSITLTDLSTNNPTSWHWYINQGGLTNHFYTQNPVLIGESNIGWAEGTVTITLEATNADGTGSLQKVAYITVLNNDPEPEVYGYPESVGGYAVGGSYSMTIDGVTFGGGTQYPAYTAGVAGGGYTGGTISTRTQLLVALSSATSGAVIYVDPTAAIALNESADENILIPSGVTLASNRGVGSSAGGRIYTTKAGSGWNKPLFRTNGNNVRVTGIRIEGECLAENAEGAGEATYRVGLWIDGHTGCVVDNCDFKGFAYANIFTDQCPTDGRPWIHHNYIHESQNQHEGYGVNVYGGDTLIEANIFHKNRHDVTGDGLADEMYEFRYNYITAYLLGVTGMSHIDVHGLAPDEIVSGARYDIHHNTCAGGREACVHQRGKPSVGTYIHHNIFYGDSSYTGVSGGVPIYQSVPSGSDFGNVFITDNYFEEVYYADDTGIFWEQST